MVTVIGVYNIYMEKITLSEISLIYGPTICLKVLILIEKIKNDIILSYVR